MMPMTMPWSVGTCWTPARLLGKKLRVVERDDLIKARSESSCGAAEGGDRSGAADLSVEEEYWYMVWLCC
jgi:hypothetical protein